jgi:hypothetical protein
VFLQLQILKLRRIHQLLNIRLEIDLVPNGKELQMKQQLRAKFEYRAFFAASDSWLAHYCD